MSRKKRFRQGGRAVFAAIICMPSAAMGAEPACPGREASKPPAAAQPRAAAESLHVTADRVEARLDESVLFSGHVELRHGGVTLLADELSYDRAENRVDARGRILLRTEAGDEFSGPLLNYWLDTGTGDSESAGFRLTRNNARGDAARLRFDGPGHMQLEDARYTTCPPGRDDWFLKAGRVELDQDSGVATARDVVLEFLDVPILYSPYFSYPLSDERKSGFLLPRIGQASKLGVFVAAPYYLNLAPNYDATLTPRLMSDRGLQLQGELRYLESDGGGQAEIEYLPRDSVTDSYRAAGVVNFAQRLSPYWDASTSLEWVSDNNYFIDLGDTTAVTSRTHLSRIAQVNYGGELWRFTGRVLHYQTIDTSIAPADRPYRQQPQLLLSAEQSAGALAYRFESEWTYFDRTSGVTGARLDLHPSISLPLRASYGFLVPRLGVRHTGYSLNGAADDNPARTLPVASLDGGLYFERLADWRGASYRQTLEPRLFYLRIPYKNQDDLPLFDGAVPDFSFYNLFRENRFIGADRVGDANQAVLAVTSRVLDGRSAAELGRVSLGQIYYFDDQQVTIPAGGASRGSSDLVGEVQAFLAPGWYLRTGLQWDQEEKRTAKGNTYLHYRPANDKIINLGYRYTQSLQEQVDISSHWPLSNQWSALGRWVYSLPEERTLQAYGGLEYKACCWAVRATARHAVLADGRTDKSIQLEFELTGLGRLGKPAENPLSQGQFLFE